MRVFSLIFLGRLTEAQRCIPKVTPKTPSFCGDTIATPKLLFIRTISSDTLTVVWLRRELFKLATDYMPQDKWEDSNLA
ncbi:MAG: hypothetical protein RML35_14150 [Chloroherpetonaceae bacterium]|nr:hypothetical protein [Chloroherpetonaceae bacterium]